MKRAKRLLIRFGFLLAIAAPLLNCGAGEADDNSLVVPRGATISVKTTSAISTGTQQTGDAFSATLNAPLQREMTVFAPMGSELDGVVEEATKQDGAGGRPRITLRLTRLHLPSGASVDLETNSITRETKLAQRKETVSIVTGLDKTIEELTGESPKEAPAGEPTEVHAVIPALSGLVFTLQSDLRVPAPE